MTGPSARDPDVCPAQPNGPGGWPGRFSAANFTNSLTVVVPRRSGETAPEIRSINNAAASVTFRSKTTTVSFDSNTPGDVVVDVGEIAD